MIKIEDMLSVDNDGNILPPNLRQILNKKVQELYLRDKDPKKTKYKQEAGFIYYIADLKSPCNQQGLNYIEARQKAIDNFGLPNNYEPDNLVLSIIDVYKNNIKASGKAVLALTRSFHNITLAADKINELLTISLNASITLEEINTITNAMETLDKQISRLPALSKALNDAYEKFIQDEEIEEARGGVKITKSMNADDYINK